MTTKKWINSNFKTEVLYGEDCIDWDNGIHTPVSMFMTLFGEVINRALETDKNPKQAIVESDPTNEKGFNDLLT